MKKVLVIYTGGTIGMQVTQEGFSPKSNYLEQQLAVLEELQAAEMPSYTLLEYQPLIDSANVTPVLWQRLAQDIQLHYETFDGFVVLHGTDAMAYTASMLSFLLENLGKPVIITGSQVPLSVIRSDAKQNMVNAIYLAAMSNIPEVCLYFNNSLLRGNRAVKMSSTRFMAFATPNYPKLARVDAAISYHKEHWLTRPSARLKVHDVMPINIMCLRLFPGMDFALLMRLLDQPLQALVLETYGSGNVPTSDPAFVSFMERAHQQHTLIVNATQCINGGVDMDTYEVGHFLKKYAVVSAHDMTAQACVTKLYYLLSQYEEGEVRRLFGQNLRGELTKT